MYTRRPLPRVVKFEEYVIIAQTVPSATPSEIAELARCHAVFLPGDPARAGRTAFWRPDGERPVAPSAGSVEELTVALPDGEGVRPARVPAVLLPVRAALPSSPARGPAPTRTGRPSSGAPSRSRPCTWWRAGCCCPVCPGPTTTPGARVRWARRRPSGCSTWPPPCRPRRTPSPRRRRTPATARPGATGPRLPRLGRRHAAPLPAAHLVTAGPAYASPVPRRLSGLRSWTADVAAGHDSGVRLSLRVEVRGLDTAESPETRPRFRAVLQVHSVRDPAVVADATEVWADTAGTRSGRARGWTRCSRCAARRVPGPR